MLELFGLVRAMTTPGSKPGVPSALELAVLNALRAVNDTMQAVEHAGDVAAAQGDRGVDHLCAVNDSSSLLTPLLFRQQLLGRLAELRTASEACTDSVPAGAVRRATRCFLVWACLLRRFAPLARLTLASA